MTASTSSGALRESAFDPLSRTCDFMLKEEAHHMFVGASGVGRVVQRTAELMNEHDTDDIARFGGINLDTLQRYINFHYSVSLDLFGSERSTNAANYYAAGLKGRFDEADYDDDHVLDDTDDTYLRGARRQDHHRDALGASPGEPAAARRLRRGLRERDCADGTASSVEADVDVELSLPHQGFHRAVGAFADHNVSPDGQVVSDAEWAAKEGEWLPTDDERAHVGSLMKPQFEEGKMAGWIAPPSRGINTQAVDYDYVRL